LELLASRGFRVAVWEPYTVILARSGFIVDLYTHPPFAWVVYIDGEKLLRCCTEKIEVNGVKANALSKEAEVVVAAAHAIYKEHMVLLIDCLTAWAWTGRGVWSLAEELGAVKALETLHSICRAIGAGYTEAPHKLGIATTTRILSEKFVRDPLFRVTIINMLKYVLGHRDIGARILNRLLRGSY